MHAYALSLCVWIVEVACIYVREMQVLRWTWRGKDLEETLGCQASWAVRWYSTWLLEARLHVHCRRPDRVCTHTWLFDGVCWTVLVSDVSFYPAAVRCSIPARYIVEHYTVLSHVTVVAGLATTNNGLSGNEHGLLMMRPESPQRVGTPYEDRNMNPFTCHDPLWASIVK